MKKRYVLAQIVIAAYFSYYFKLKFLPKLPPADLDSEANQKVLQRHLRPLFGNLLECHAAAPNDCVRKYGPPVEFTVYSWEDANEARHYHLFGCTYNGLRI